MKIRVAICQVDMEWENTARNLKRLEPIVAAADADVVVLPEMFATGFKLRPSCVAEPADGLVVTTMRRWAAQYGRAVVGSVVVAEQERFRNRMFFVKPSGETAWYDKRHLFRPGGEARDYTPGDRRVIVEYMGFRFLLLVCYDLRFPVWSRQPGRLRRHFVQRLVGRRPARGVAHAAPRPRHREPVLSGGREPCRYGSRRKLCGRFGADRLRRPDAGRRRRPRTDADRRIRLRSSDGLQGEISRMDGCRRLRTEVLRL